MVRELLYPPMRSLLSKDAILFHLRIGNIFIFPFEAGQLNPLDDLTGLEDYVNLQTTSYDVRLGEYFYQQQDFGFNRKILNPFDPRDIERLWGSPKQAVLAGEWMKQNGNLVNIEPEDKIIILGPGETILAHTQEFIGGRRCVTTEMRAKSSMGRIGVTVCKCAGWGDAGFCNRWTMEMTNHLKETAVLLLVGMRVAQIPFYQIDPVKTSYAIQGGQYQHTDNTDEMIKNWHPSLMLPKFKRDKYMLPKQM